MISDDEDFRGREPDDVRERSEEGPRRSSRRHAARATADAEGRMQDEHHIAVDDSFDLVLQVGVRLNYTMPLSVLLKLRLSVV